MKKILLTLITLATSLISFSQQASIKAFFKGFDTETGIYLFEDANQSIIEFNEVAPKVLTQFKLQSDDLIDKSYLVTYTIIEIEDEDGFVIEENKIIKLEEITLEYNTNEGDLDEDEEN